MDWITIAADFGTIVLAGSAIFAGVLAYRNISILRNQHRYNTFLGLMSDISSESARRNRALINACLEPDEGGQYPAEIETSQIWVIGVDGTRVTDAIEDTVVCLDKVGFFLLRGDPKLKEEAPMGVWTVTSEMWTKLGNYVKKKQQSNHTYGKYFEELFKECEVRGYSLSESKA